MYSSLLLTLLMFFAQNGQEYYQQALVQERAAGNLEAAIQLYQDAARYAGNDRALAAQALMGAARCYEKLGQAKARELYEEIAKTYPDQQQQAAVALERLAESGPHTVRTIVHVDENTVHDRHGYRDVARRPEDLPGRECLGAVVHTNANIS